MINNLIVKTKIKFPIRINLEYLGAFLLIVFCNFWVYKAKPVTPLYYFFFISLFVFFISFIRQKSIQIISPQITSLVCASYIFIVSFFHKNPVVNTILHCGVTFIFYFLTIYYLNYLKKTQVLNIVKNLYIYTCSYISIETLYRLTHFTTFRTPEEGAHIEGTIYVFKMNSIMFQDSNFVSLITLIMVFLAFYIFRYIDKNSLFFRVMCLTFILLTILTFSRAAIAAIVITFTIYYSFCAIKKGLAALLNNHILTLRFFIFIPTFIILLLSVIVGLFWLLSDGSFLTKVKIFADLITYTQKVSFSNLLIGIGADLQGILQYFHYATHALIPTYLVWYGLISLFLIAYFWLQNIKYTKLKGLLIIIPIFIAGISLGIAIIHIFYISLAIITYFEYILPKQKRRLNAVSINNSSNL